MIAIYARVSTEEQARSGYSLKDQVRECKRKAGAETVKEYIDEGISGEFLDRPGLSKLREDVRDGLITKVICLDPDRLSRKLVNTLLVSDEIEKRAELIFVNGEYQSSPEGRLFFSLRGAVAEFEKAKINERMSRGRKQKARQGKVVKNYQVYGYDYDKEKCQFVINEEEAAVVRMIFDLFTKPNADVRGVNGIAKKLTALGIPTKRNAANGWHKQTINQLLRHEVYVGQFYQNRWNTEGMLGNKFSDTDEKVRMSERPRDEWIELSCPAIIDKEQFEYAQKLLDEARRRFNGSERHEYLLSGLLRCKDCGNTMTGRKAKNWSTYVYQYTDLKNLAGVKNPGCGHKVKCSDLDEAIWNTIVAWMQSPAEVAATMTEDEPPTSYEQAALERIEHEIEKAKNGQRKLFNLLVADDGLLEDDIRQELNDLKSKELSLLESKTELEEALANIQRHEFPVNLLLEAAEHYMRKKPEDLMLSDQREIIRLIVREIRLSKDGTIDIITF